MGKEVYALLEGNTGTHYIAPYSTIEKAKEGAKLWNQNYGKSKITWKQDSPNMWVGGCAYKSDEGSFTVHYQIVKTELDPADCRDYFFEVQHPAMPDFEKEGGPDAQLQIQAGKNNPT